MSLLQIPLLKYNTGTNFFLIAAPCMIEGEEIAFRIAEIIVAVSEKLQIPFIFKGSYRKANRSRLDSFTGIRDKKALKILSNISREFGVPTLTDIHESSEAAMAAEFPDVLQLPLLTKLLRIRQAIIKA